MHFFFKAGLYYIYNKIKPSPVSYSFCTISTESHLYKCFALADSIAKYGGMLNILLVNSKAVNEKAIPKNVVFHFLDDLKSNNALAIIKKYKGKLDELRWSLKSVYLIYLLKHSDKLIYVDNDILFFNDYRFLFDLLNQNNILLTPHHYKREPGKEQNWLEANFRVGLYNAGFVGVNKEAEKTLEWWSEACLYRCEKNYFRGLFDDQKYLDLFPILEEKTHIVRHEGCNVAAWNASILQLETINGKFIINQSFALVFYHFNYYSLKKLQESDALFKHYLNYLKPYKKDLSSLVLEDKLRFSAKVKLKIWQILNQLNK